MTENYIVRWCEIGKDNCEHQTKRFDVFGAANEFYVVTLSIDVRWKSMYQEDSAFNEVLVKSANFETGRFVDPIDLEKCQMCEDSEEKLEEFHGELYCADCLDWIMMDGMCSSVPHKKEVVGD
jgi:hypothetical protein